MKILKIALQNLNSLKSDTPIEIDFENGNLKDAGLYAITGATGAGKTTILDAITIALYHSVPRFNSTKGTLLDIVSYGATEAFSQVTFENDHHTYEAYWGIRLASKSGKILANPQEEVSLKNLTNDTILGSQKRDVLKEVHKVTQLDYNQFLKSVMLAQGEFASFLSAKGPEKGQLLEQITGEQIYKKIGQEVLDRKGKAENQLREIESKINSDDILSEERKIQLEAEAKSLDGQLATTNQALKEVESIAKWFEKFKELANKSIQLEQDAQALQDDEAKHQSEFELLALNEKAEPFKELLQNFNRNQTSVIDKKSEVASLDKELASLKPKIQELDERTTKNKDELKLAETTYNEWQPKLVSVTQWDEELKNRNKEQVKSQKLLEEAQTKLTKLENEKKDTTQESATTAKRIRKGEDYVIQKGFLAEVNKEIADWSASLATLKEYTEARNTAKAILEQKQLSLKKTNSEFAANQELLENKKLEIKEITDEKEQIDQELNQYKSVDLVTKQQQLYKVAQNWEAFKAYSEEHCKLEKKLTDYKKQKDADALKFTTLETELTALERQIQEQKQAVADAQKILDLEKSIAKYEQDRQHLVDGEPCGLCGSLQHPFAENNRNSATSQAELELRTRKDNLETVTKDCADKEKEQVKTKAGIDNNEEQIKSTKEQLASILSKATALEMGVELGDKEKIETEITQAQQQMQLVQEEVKTSKKLQDRKENLTTSHETENNTLKKFQATDTTLDERRKNLNSDIQNQQNTIANLNTQCTELEKVLNTKLGRFNYKLPAVENTKSFTDSIRAEIAQFQKGETRLEKLKAELAQLEKDLNHTESNINTEQTAIETYGKAIAENKTQIDKIRQKRIDILPLESTVEAKHTILQDARQEAANKLETSKKDLQEQLDAQTEKEAIKVKTLAEQEKLAEEHKTLQSDLDNVISASDFATKEGIEDALLTQEEKQQYQQNKKQLDERKLSLTTLRASNLRAIEEQNKTRTFQTTEAENEAHRTDLELKTKTLSEEKGKIQEAFRKDQEIIDRNEGIYKEIKEQEAVCNIWRELYRIIGGSKEAFNVYVQRLTLKHLLDLANVHLFKLNKRYSLKMEDTYKPKEELNFSLIDHYQTDQSRLVDTCSGGEKFIISLALALGLSDLASKNVRIDSLFIDEGFGTLDKNTLETVISTLETLQSQGKMIGIISHVENLKERIPTQIVINKKSTGMSTVGITS